MLNVKSFVHTACMILQMNSLRLDCYFSMNLFEIAFFYDTLLGYSNLICVSSRSADPAFSKLVLKNCIFWIVFQQNSLSYVHIISDVWACFLVIYKPIINQARTWSKAHSIRGKIREKRHKTHPLLIFICKYKIISVIITVHCF